MTTEPTDIPELDDLAGYGELDSQALHVVGTDPVTVVRPPIPLRPTVPPQEARDLMAGAGIDMAHFDAEMRHQAQTERLWDAVGEAREGAEVLAHAAQAIVDAADEWAAAWGLDDVGVIDRPLLAAVLAWRAVRDGRAS